MRRLRRSLPDTAAAASGQAVAARLRELEVYARACAVALYVATDGEVPTGPIIEAALRDGKRVYLPRFSGERLQLAEQRAGRPLRIGRFSIPEPDGPALAEADRGLVLVVVPVVAWDRVGHRLGRGGGHYDRLLAAGWAEGRLVGIAYPQQEVEAVPTDPWDVPLNYVVTDRETVRCRHASPRSREEGSKAHGIWNRNHHVQSRAGDRPGRRPRSAAS